MHDELPIQRLQRLEHDLSELLLIVRTAIRAPQSRAWLLNLSQSSGLIGRVAEGLQHFKPHHSRRHPCTQETSHEQSQAHPA